jgi:hypothetical protein
MKEVATTGATMTKAQAKNIKKLQKAAKREGVLFLRATALKEIGLALGAPSPHKAAMHMTAARTALEY